MIASFGSLEPSDTNTLIPRITPRSGTAFAAVNPSPRNASSNFISGAYSRTIRRSGVTSEFAVPPTATDATPRNPVPAPAVRSSDASSGGFSSIAAARASPPFEKFTCASMNPA
jgi:hypothetical protein